MTWNDTARFAWTALTRHRRRSALSILGVMVGVAAVVVLTALGEGARRYVVGEFASLGTNLLIVLPGKNETTGMFPGVTGVPNDLTLDDARALQRELRQGRLVVPIAVGNDTVSHFERRRQVLVLGSTADFLETRELAMGAGRFLPPGEMDRGAPVAVLGLKVAEELFPGQSPLGQVLRIGDWRMRVIGVLERTGTQIGLDVDDTVVIPVASAMRMFDRTSLFRILIKVGAYGDLEAAQERVIAILSERHGEEDITCITQKSVIASLSKIMNALTLALAGIAAVSLSVAGLGVMNLMLVSVSERTAEVGLLKAVGASEAQVLGIFLAEAVLLAAFGALAGLCLGWLLVQVFVMVYPAFPASPPVWAVASVTVLAIGLGALFGVLPARRATRLDPVAALAGK
ncbi:MAG: ABC transporter permease [Myxococcota bacterium]